MKEELRKQIKEILWMPDLHDPITHANHPVTKVCWTEEALETLTNKLMDLFEAKNIPKLL